MRVVVAGSRTITDPAAVAAAIAASGFHVTELVSGGARGVDVLAEAWARARGIPVRRFLPDYDRYPSKVAPIRRNQQMAAYAAAAPEGGCLIAAWDGVSRGTLHMIGFAREHGLAVYVYRADLAAVLAT